MKFVFSIFYIILLCTIISAFPNGKVKSCSNTQCHQFCQQSESDEPECYCSLGYILDTDNITCKLDQSGPGVLLFSTAHEIRSLSLVPPKTHYPDETPTMQVLIKDHIGDVEGVSTSIAKQTIYYTSKGRIHTVQGQHKGCLVDGLSEHGTNIAVDWVTGNLYFTNEEPAILGLCRPDGQFCTYLFTEKDGLKSPRGLALYPKFGILFWTDWRNGKIGRANMDGTNSTFIVQYGLRSPNSVTIDYTHQILYIADSDTQSIGRCRFDGTEWRVVFRSDTIHPVHMVVLEDNAYWTDWREQGVLMTSVSNQSDNYHKFYSTRGESTIGISLISPNYQEAGLSNPCLEAKCSHICTLRLMEEEEEETTPVEASCLCPVGYQFENDGRSQCIPSKQYKFEMRTEWCLSAFEEACKEGNACENGGQCIVQQDQYEIVFGATCQCPDQFTGTYCEVKEEPDHVNSDQQYQENVEIESSMHVEQEFESLFEPIYQESESDEERRMGVDPSDEMVWNVPVPHQEIRFPGEDWDLDNQEGRMEEDQQDSVEMKPPYQQEEEQQPDMKVQADSVKENGTSSSISFTTLSCFTVLALGFISGLYLYL